MEDRFPHELDPADLDEGDCINTASYASLRKSLGKTLPKGTARDRLMPRIRTLGKRSFTLEDLVGALDREVSGYADEYLEGLYVLAYNHYGETIVAALINDKTQREQILNFWRETIQSRLSEEDFRLAETQQMSKKEDAFSVQVPSSSQRGPGH